MPFQEKPPTENPVINPSTPKVEHITDFEEQYGNLDTFFSMEDLKAHYEEVLEQIKAIRGAIEDYEEQRERLQTDPDADVYADEAMMKVERLMKNFCLNGKCINLLEKTGEYVKVANDLIYDVNQWAELFMIKESPQPIRYIEER